MLVFDIETDGLLETLTKVWTITLYDTDSKTYETYDRECISEAIKTIASADRIAGHNLLSFDLPAIKKVFPEFRYTGEILDTLIWSRLEYPDLKVIDSANYLKWNMPSKLIGSHSLKSWGFRLKEYKGDFSETTDWSEWSPEMSDYCKQDVVVTVKLLEKLQTKHTSMQALELEQEVSKIVDQQVKNGWLFDIKKAEELYVYLLRKQSEIEEPLKKLFPPFLKEEVKVPKRNDKTKGWEKGVPFTKITEIPFKPSSRAHIIRAFKDKYGWKPTEFTKAGQPKVDDDVLNSLPYPEAKPLAEYFMIQKRLGMLGDGDKAWLKLVKPDRRIHGGIISCGTPTRRARHGTPNITQIPKVKAPYGKECRELFIVPKGYSLVDVDASQLELRCLAHYLAKWDGGKYTEQIVSADIHEYNRSAAGLSTRDQAKTMIYCLNYGGGDEKLGEVIGKGAKEGRALRNKFMKNMPAFKNLLEAIQRFAKEKGYIPSIDGQKIKLRSNHTALNYLLQSCGSIIMKRAMVILHQDLKDSGLIEGVDYKQIAFVHDAFDFEVKTEYAERVGKMIVESIRKAGEYYKLRCPMSGEYHIGNNYSEVH